jgi:aspartate aminotransferase-like enzyme
LERRKLNLLKKKKGAFHQRKEEFQIAVGSGYLPYERKLWRVGGNNIAVLNK